MRLFSHAPDYNSIGSLHPMSQLYEAIKRAEEVRSTSEWATAGSLGAMEMPERRHVRRWDLGTKHTSHGTSNEAPVEIATCVTATLDTLVPSEIFLMHPIPECVAEMDISVPSAESMMDGDVLPMSVLVEALEIAFSYITVERIEEIPGLPAQEVAQDVEIASIMSPSGDAVSTEIIPMQEAAVAVEPGPPLVADDDAADLRACPAQETAAVVLPTSLVEVVKEPLPPSNFLAFYGLNQQPFDVTPDPAYLYLSRGHSEALTSLTQGIENMRGFIALVADPGMGKTTLLNKLTEELGDQARVVHLFQTQCNSIELLRYLLSELRVEYDATDVVSMHRALNEVLFKEMLQGKRFVLIVDEAQNLQD